MDIITTLNVKTLDCYRCSRCGNTNENGRGFIWKGDSPVSCTKCGCNKIDSLVKVIK